ncbi:MAG: nitrogen fixation protein NifQ [Rhodocyclaceae bacterium]|nr:nitrogen fixation protein NifQ [Rhodocyclaceae bacterium]
MADLSVQTSIRSRSDAPRAAMVAHLMSRASGLANDATLASLLAGWTLGRGCLPADLGLGREGFTQCVGEHFPDLAWRLPERDDPAIEAARERALEMGDLIRLLQDHADLEVAGALDMALIVASGCLGSDHLWQDLGLASRGELGELMRRNFPTLAARNDRDMKWKKFLYRQLCELEGLVICRAPSCEACSEFDDCFGPEQ